MPMPDGALLKKGVDLESIKTSLVSQCTIRTSAAPERSSDFIWPSAPHLAEDALIRAMTGNKRPSTGGHLAPR
jgi:hypothetical protein